MQINNIPLSSSGQLHPLAKDYIQHPENLKEYFSFTPDMDGIEEAIKARKQFPVIRTILTENLHSQYLSLDSDFFAKEENGRVKSNIEKLNFENTFTITTGHQLNIFTGPLYFIYKIISAINYARILSEKYPEYNLIPVYWMATEDHDFEEINHIHLFGKTLKWETESGGAVGRINPESLAPVIAELSEMISRQEAGKELIQIFTKAYFEYPTLSLATRYIVNEFFKADGLLILDADTASLKQQFIPVLKEDILNNTPFKNVAATKTKLETSGYELPVNPREINVFYLGKNSRTRIIKTDTGFSAGNKNWTLEELLSELNSYAENFSPNVVLRPMYQESILPNLCYIGGNNEIAYWLELKNAFDQQKIFFLQLLVRDSALWISSRMAKDMEALKIELSDLFLPLNEIKQLFYSRNELRNPTEDTLDTITQSYEKLKEEAQKLSSDIAAQIVKQSNEHQKELKRLSKEIQKKKEESNEKNLAKIDKIYSSIFPESDFQERYDNFISLYLQYGTDFFSVLKENFNPADGMLRVITDRN